MPARKVSELSDEAFEHYIDGFIKDAKRRGRQRVPTYYKHIDALLERIEKEVANLFRTDTGTMIDTVHKPYIKGRNSVRAELRQKLSAIKEGIK